MEKAFSELICEDIKNVLIQDNLSVLIKSNGKEEKIYDCKDILERMNIDISKLKEFEV